MEPKHTILVAEDDSSNYLYFAALLRGQYKLLWAKNGMEAVDMALSNDVSVVLMDYKMPGMTGIEAMKRIKQQKPNMKVVIQTAYALEEHKQVAIYEGADEFLTKPIFRDTILETLDRMIEK